MAGPVGGTAASETTTSRLDKAGSATQSGDLQLVSVRKQFGGFVAVDDLTLTIPSGSFFALLGPSGCGKTTTLRIVAGLEHPTSGQILIGGDDVTSTRAHQRPVNTVFQSYALFPHLDVGENVAFGLRRRGVKDAAARAMEALDLVELRHLARRKPSQLSGGQQQRVALARAIVNNPAVLLLDEPLGALDLKLRRQMQVELKRIQTEVGLTFVHVTHDQEEAMTMADTVAVMNAGRIERPSGSIRPAFITATVSAIVMASSWSCVTCTNVRPTSSWIRLSSTCICRRSLRSSAPSGSSSSSTAGLLTIARARATRCCCPPGELGRLAPARWPQLDQVERRPSPALGVRTRLRRSPNATFSVTSRCGNSA